MAVVERRSLVTSLESEIERVQDDIRGVDEKMRRLSGWDPHFDSSRGRRRVPSFSRDDEPPPKRRSFGGVFARLSGNMLDGRKEPRSQIEDRPRDRRRMEDERPRELMDDDDTPKPSVLSSVIRPEGKSRTEAAAQLTKDKDSRERNKRMFGALMGTLQRFRNDEAKQKDKGELRAAIDKKLADKGRAEEEEIRRERQELFNRRRQDHAIILKLNMKKEQLKEHEVWEENQKQMTKFIRTKAKPPVFWLPKVASSKSNRLISVTKDVLHKEIADKRRGLEVELSELMEEVQERELEEQESDREERGGRGMGGRPSFPPHGEDMLEYEAEEGELVFDKTDLVIKTGKDNSGGRRRMVVQVPRGYGNKGGRRVELVTRTIQNKKRSLRRDSSSSEEEVQVKREKLGKEKKKSKKEEKKKDKKKKLKRKDSVKSKTDDNMDDLPALPTNMVRAFDMGDSEEEGEYLPPRLTSIVIKKEKSDRSLKLDQETNGKVDVPEIVKPKVRPRWDVKEKRVVLEPIQNSDSELLNKSHKTDRKHAIQNGASETAHKNVPTNDESFDRSPKSALSCSPSPASESHSESQSSPEKKKKHLKDESKSKKDVERSNSRQSSEKAKSSSRKVESHDSKHRSSTMESNKSKDNSSKLAKSKYSESDNRKDSGKNSDNTRKGKENKHQNKESEKRHERDTNKNKERESSRSMSRKSESKGRESSKAEESSSSPEKKDRKSRSSRGNSPKRSRKSRSSDYSSSSSDRESDSKSGTSDSDSDSSNSEKSSDGESRSRKNKRSFDRKQKQDSDSDSDDDRKNDRSDRSRKVSGSKGNDRSRGESNRKDSREKRSRSRDRKRR